MESKKRRGFGKRGLGPIIAVVLLILITIAAGAIIAGFVVPFVRNGLDESTRCVDFEGYYGFKEKIEFNKLEYRYNCYDSIGEKQGFSISSNSVGEKDVGNIEGFNVVLYRENGESVVLKIEDGKETVGVNVLGEAQGELEIPKQGEITTYVYQTAGERFKRMEVYPIVKGRICGVSDEIDIVPCVIDLGILD